MRIGQKILGLPELEPLEAACDSVQGFFKGCITCPCPNPEP